MNSFFILVFIGIFSTTRVHSQVSNVTCYECDTTFQCQDGKYLYTYTQDYSTHTITQSKIWSTAGIDTESGKPLYTTTKWDGCYQGDKMWPRVESDDSPNLQLIINSLIYNTVVENQRILKTQRCSLINKRKKCKAAGCVWNKKECLWSEDVSNDSGMLGMINAKMNGLFTGGIDHSNGGGTIGPPSGRV